MSQEELGEIRELIATVGRLVAFSLTRGKESRKNKILLLNRLGMSKIDIASVLDTTENNVAVTISRA